MRMSDAIRRQRHMMGGAHFLVVGLFLAGLGQFYLGRDALHTGLVLYAVGLPLAVYGVLGEGPYRASDPTADESDPRRSSSRPIGVALGVIALLGEAILLILQRLDFLGSGAIWPWCLVCWGLFGLGILVYEGLSHRWPRVGRWELLALVGILALAAITRTCALADMPYGLWGDEANDGLEVLRVLKGEVPTPFATDWGGNPLMHQWINALFFLAFGATPFVLRLVAAVSGIVCVFLTYVLGRQLWNRYLGLVAAFLLAVSHWHIHHSRFNSVVIQGIPFQLLAFIFFFRALRTRRLGDFAWCGLACGVGFHFYHALRIVPIIIVIVVLYEAISRPRGFVRRYGRGCVIAACAAVLVFAPLGFFYLDRSETLLGRADSVSILNTPSHFRTRFPDVEPTPWNMVRIQTGATALMFNYRGDGNSAFNWPHKPMLDALTGVLFVLGVAYAAWRWRDERNFFLLAWLMPTLTLGSVLTVDAPHSMRTSGAIPAVALLAALSVHRVWTRLAEGRSRSWRYMLGVDALICLTLIAGANLQAYFGGFMGAQENWYASGGVAKTMGDYMRPFAGAYRFHFLGSPHAHVSKSVLRFIVGPFDSSNLDWSEEVAMDRRLADRGVIYLTFRKELLAYVEGYCPPGKSRLFRDPWGKPLFWSYRLETEEIQACKGLVGRYYSGSRWFGEPVMMQVDAPLAFGWEAKRPFSVEWQGSLLSDGEHSILALVTDAWASLELDGEVVIQGEGGGESAVRLDPGIRRLTVRAAVPQGSTHLTLAWGRPGEPLTPIPDEVLGR